MAARTAQPAARGRSAAPATRTPAPAARGRAAAAPPARQAPAPAGNRRGQAATSQAAGNRQPPPRNPPAAAGAAPAGRGRGGGDDIARQLAAMEASWNGSKADSKQNDFELLVPAGSYVTQLVGQRVFGYGKKQIAIVLEFTVIEGDEQGQAISIFRELTDPDKLVWAQRDLRKLGSDVDSLAAKDIPAEAEALVQAAPEVRIIVKPGKEPGSLFANISKLITPGDGTDLNEPLQPGAETESQVDPNGDPNADPGDPLENDEVEWKQGRAKFTGVVQTVDADNRQVVVLEDKSQTQVTLGFDDITIILPPDDGSQQQ
jgi:hypothetical protein